MKMVFGKNPKENLEMDILYFKGTSRCQSILKIQLMSDFIHVTQSCYFKINSTSGLKRI